MLGQSIVGIVLAILLAAPGGDTRLPDAAMQGAREAVQSLLDQNVDVDAAQADGNTALHWAAYRDDMEMARLLVQADANVHAGTNPGDLTPLLMAARNGSAAMIELLLKAGSDANSTNANGTTPLMFAAASGNIDALRILLGHGAEVSATDIPNGQTALMFAAARNRGAAIQLLATYGADLRTTSRVSTVKPFGRFGVPGEEEDSKKTTEMGGNTPLHFAAREGHMDAVRELIAAGADVNQASVSDNMSPLTQAIINGNFDIAKFLLDQGADPDIASTKDGLFPLWVTIDARYAHREWYPAPSVEQEKTDYLDLMKELLALGANPNARLGAKPWFRTFGNSNGPDPAGSTAFWRAAQANDVTAMKLLLAAGADPDIATTHGCSPLQVAVGMENDFQGTNVVPNARVDAARFLVEEVGVDVNSRDDRGYSALHGAAFIGRNDVILYLVEKGADVGARAHQISNGSSKQSAEPDQGDTVADMANGWTQKTLQFNETVDLLIELGSEFSDTCWASVCVNPTRPDKAPNNKQK
jgi:ankyrin repeat protein